MGQHTKKDPVLVISTGSYNICYLFSLFQLLKDVAEVHFLGDDCVEILDLYALLLHRVTMTDGHAAVVE